MLTTKRILEESGMKVFDVEEIPTHGGSLRVFACRAEAQTRAVAPSVAKLIADEKRAGLDSPEGYDRFALEVRKTKRELLEFLPTAARQGKTVAPVTAPQARAQRF